MALANDEIIILQCQAAAAPCQVPVRDRRRSPLHSEPPVAWCRAMADAGPEIVNAFIERWSASGGAERSNYQLFLTELCRLLDVPTPDPAREENALNDYVFERSLDRRARSWLPFHRTELVNALGAAGGSEACS